MADPRPLQHGFWHIRPWEVAFVAFIASLLAVSIVHINSLERVYKLPSEMAMLISVVTMTSMTYAIKRKTNWERDYPVQIRWPALGGLASVAVEFWRIRVRVGPEFDARWVAFTTSLVVILAVAIVFFEVVTRRRARMGPPQSEIAMAPCCGKPRALG